MYRHIYIYVYSIQRAIHTFTKLPQNLTLSEIAGLVDSTHQRAWRTKAGIVLLKNGREMTVESLGRFVDESWSRLNCVADFVVSFFSSNSRCMTVRWIGVKLGLDHFTGMSMVGT